MNKKWIAGVMALTLGVSVLAGCASEKETGDKPTVSVTVFDRGQISSSEGNYAENRWTKYINEHSGVDVNWVPIPRNEATQKINMLVASGDAPDLIVEYDIALMSSLVEQGVIQPIDEFVEKYSTEYKEYLEQNPSLRDFVTYNGKMYMATSKRSQDAVINHGMWIRRDWLDKLGLSMPQTAEELLEVARAFRDGDPDGNGINDTTAFSIINWHEIFPSMFQASNLWYNENGEIKFGHTLDRYGESLRYMKTLYDEGLIDKEFITDKDGTRQRQLWVNGKAGIYTKSWTEVDNKELLQNNPNAQPAPLKPVSTQYGLNALWQEAEPLYYVAFNRNIKDPAAAMKFLDWMISDGWKTIKFGIEGEHYTEENGVPRVLDLEKQTQEVSYAADYMVLSQWNVKPEWIPQMAAQDDLSQKLAQQRGESLKVNSEVSFRRDIPIEPPLESKMKLISEFGTIRDDVRMKVIAGGSQYTPEWGMNELKREWTRLGGEAVEKEMTQWYNANH